MRKILISARDCCNIVRTFGDDDLKATFAKMELSKLPAMITEVQNHINHINQKEMFSKEDETSVMINQAMNDIEFTFSKISSEEMKLIAGTEVKEKWQKTINEFTENFDQDDPAYISLREAFLTRFKEHGFVIDSVAVFNEHSKTLDDILRKLQELQIRNYALVKKYKGDVKFARVHKRIREANSERIASNTIPIISEYDDDIMGVLTAIKTDVDQKVYDRYDILKQDTYFERTVMQQVTQGLDNLGYKNDRTDRVFIQNNVTKQYLEQYNATYSFV